MGKQKQRSDGVTEGTVVGRDAEAGVLVGVEGGSGGGCVSSGVDEALPSPSSSTIAFRERKTRKVLNSGEKRENRKAKADAIIVPPLRTLSEEGAIALAIQHLKACDPLLGRLIDIHHPPIFHKQHTPFHSLARSILYQQLAIKAAASIYSRFIALCGGESGVVPETVLRLSPLQLRQIGVSARKAGYLHDLAAKFSDGLLSDAAILEMDDQSLVSMLTMVKGIGVWSVHMFMIFALHRPDVLPVGDVGVRKGVQLLYGLNQLPQPSQMDKFCDRWRPYRSVGSWYMWRLVEAKGPTVPADQLPRLV
ncbi:DNA-3-methyladenine glycosylase 1-like isoform X2 [Nymphaea colorata]|nr:DNA-3-methyladenine glycosylase 1-like isoform X2 [Nymphaea colorata]XP_031475229.1 DNA-3-methyladenine glycosylase 1-like isoform X2 [Nymphaea colorata]